MSKIAVAPPSPAASFAPVAARVPSGLDGRVAAALDALCAAPALHARFLNTLALMEHIGSRKIMVSQSRAAPDAETLKHLAEETRHAFFFKRAAESVSGGPLSWRGGDMIAGAAGAMYMGRLDAYIAAALKDAPSRAAYLTMSLVVELRAVWFYGLYQQALARAGVPLSLKGVLAEEEMHLRGMRADLAAIDPGFDARLEGFMRFEEGLFLRLWTAVESALPRAA